MSEEVKDFIVGLLIGLCILGGILAYDISQWRSDTVKHGCAAYDTTTGKWGWIERRGEERP